MLNNRTPNMTCIRCGKAFFAYQREIELGRKHCTTECRKTANHDEGPNPSGICMCGCGGTTPLAQKTSAHSGWVQGKPMKYILGHNRTMRTYTINDDTGCWEWSGKPNPKGYGTTEVKGANMSAHRYMYELHIGLVPNGLILDHLCRNRICVNPTHLEPVTVAENNRRGKLAKIDARTAARIKTLLKDGTPTSVARDTGISYHIIYCIAKGRTWADIEAA